MVDAALGTTVTVDAILDGPTETHHPAGHPARLGDDAARARHAAPAFRCARRPARPHRGRRAVATGPQGHRAAARTQANRGRDVAEVKSARGIAAAQRRIVQPAARDVLRPLSRWPRLSQALFYVDSLPGVGELAVVDGDEGFHAATVRRIRVGEASCSATAPGPWPHCVVDRTGQGPTDGSRCCRAGRRPAARRGHRRAGAAQGRALRTGGRAGHRGRRRRLRRLAGRPVRGPLGRAKVDKGLRRWRAVARSAARQSRRAFIPRSAGW